MWNFSFIAFTLLTLLASEQSAAQHIQVGSPLEQLTRERQLMTPSSIRYSMTVRPMGIYRGERDSLVRFLSPDTVQQDLIPGVLSVQPAQVDLSFNSYRPFGWNNGSMITAKGLQMRVSAGMHYRTRLFEVNLQPEFVSAANRPYSFSNRFGGTVKGAYTKSFLGQSYAEIKLGKVGIGFSNENMWLGPGQKSALIMTNNAPGFGHIYIASREPIKTPIVDLEWKIFGGGLDQDSLLNSESNFQQNASFTRQWPHLNVVTLTLKPKFLPGLYLGFNRALQFYGNKEDSSIVGFFNKYTPAVSAFFKKKINTQIDAPSENDGQDQIASVFMRFVLPKERMEFYFEYGYNDFKANTRDLIQDVQHSAAYLVGFKKLTSIKNGIYYTVSGEVVQMAQSASFVTRNAGNWYTIGSGSILQGMTHMSQILGASSGLGNNVQSIQVERVSGVNRGGFTLMRIQNDPKGIQGGVNNIWISPLAWTDIVYGPNIQWRFNNLLLRGEMQCVHSNNYAWINKNQFNLFTATSLIYKW